MMSLRSRAAALVVVGIAVTIGLMASGGLRTADAQAECVEVEEGLEFCLSLDPETATNTVGTDHALTATFSVIIEGEPFEGDLSGALVMILVFDGPNVDDGAAGTTDGGGEFALIYTGDGGAGTDSIVACLGPEVGLCFFLGPDEVFLDDFATKDWVEPPPTITLDPPTATNTVGEDHVVTATVTEDDVPVAAFSVTILVFDGPNAGAIAQGESNQDGKFSITYTGDGGQGTDDIIAIACEREGACGLQIDLCLGLPEACVANTDGNCLETLDCDVDVATKEWVEPTPTPTATATAVPTAVLAATATPAPTATATPAPTAVLPAALPATGGEPAGGFGLPWLALAIGALVVTSGGLALAYQRRRVR